MILFNRNVKNNIPIIEKPKVLFYTKKEFANYIIFMIFRVVNDSLFKAILRQPANVFTLTSSSPDWRLRTEFRHVSSLQAQTVFQLNIHFQGLCMFEYESLSLCFVQCNT
jgi:hypothetical protein